MRLGVIAYLLACVVAGWGITYLTRLNLLLEERLAFGAVLGGVGATMGGYVLALLIGFGLVSVLGGLGITWAISLIGWYLGRREIPADLRSIVSRWRLRFTEPENPWPLLVVVAVCWPYTLRLLSQAYKVWPEGLFAGHLDVWSDWSAQLTYAGSFAYGHNYPFPPEMPTDPGHSLDFHFMNDFAAANLVPLGASLTSALVYSAALFAFAFPVVFYLAARRLSGGRAIALIALFVFLLSGGLGFVYLFGDIDKLGFGALLHLPHEYTTNRDLNYWVINPVISFLYPQRPALFGMSIFLVVIALLWMAKKSDSWAPFFFCGVLVGLTPLFQIHAYGTAVMIGVCWALLSQNRRSLAFIVPALVLGLPQVISILPPTSAVRVQLGWMADTAGHHDGVIWFWLKNTGLFVPLLLVAQFWRGLLPNGFALFFAPMWLWFLVPNVIVFHPWDWDNTHYFAYWTMLASIMIAAVLVKLFRRSAEGRALAISAFAVLTLAGSLDLARAVDYQVSAQKLTDTEGIAMADWVRNRTDARSIFLAAPVHTQPLSALGGRRIVVGFPGWVWDLGMPDLNDRLADDALMFHGTSNTPDLLRKYHIDYVLIGPSERANPWSANEEYWHSHGSVVYDSGGYTIYRPR
jgi:hypothetical protein